MTKETLSDKIYGEDYISVIKTKDVKEFIKDLKSGIEAEMKVAEKHKSNVRTEQTITILRIVLTGINTLAGKDLI